MAAGAWCGCGASVAADQRYCLRCGAPTARGEALRAVAFGGSGDAQLAPLAAEVASPPARRVRLPGSGAELPIGTATAVFALVLGTSAWAGARATSPPIANPQTYTYAAGQPVAPAPLPPTAALPGAPVPAEDLAGDVAGITDTGGLAAPAEDPVATPSAATDDSGSDAAEEPSTDDPAETTPAEQASTPTLQRVVLISLPALPYEAIGDPAGPAPYLAGTLAAQGVTLRAFSATSSSLLASRIALLTGQAPNAATIAGCPEPGPLAPGTIGEDDQAAGSGCRYSPDVFSAGDLLASGERSWKVYAAQVPADCSALPDGTPWPAGRPTPLLLGALTESADCATRLAPTSQLAGDLRGEDGPALAYVELGGSSAAEVDAQLRVLVPELRSALESTEESAILLVPSAAAPGADGSVDRAACCSRPWITDQATGGGGRTGAVLLSALAKPGTVLDEPVDHYDVLKTVSTALGVRPLGYAGRAEVTGLPREAWGRWKGAAAVDPTQTAG